MCRTSEYPLVLMKMDMLPGKVNKFQVKPTEIGVFQGKCAELMGEWGSVSGYSSTDHPASFADALINAESVGFVLGGGSGLGHGITGTGTIIVTGFNAE